MSNKREASVRLKSGMQFGVETGSGHQFSIDSSKPPAGVNAGPSPMELLLVGLAGCTAMDVASILRKMRQPFDGLQVNVSGTRAERHPKVYTEIHIEYVVAGGQVEPDSVEKAINLSVNNYCSASAMMKETAELTTSFRIE